MIAIINNLFKQSAIVKTWTVSLLLAGVSQTSGAGLHHLNEKSIVGPSDNNSLTLPPSSKKGVGAWQYNWSFGSYLDALDQVKVSWTYNWNAEDFIKIDQTKCKDVEFVPMIRTPVDLTPQNIQKIKSSNAKAILTFNEPDLASQDNSSPQALVSQWPALESLNVRIGSPAPAIGFQKGGWFDQFYNLAKSNGYRIDFISAHYYSPYYDDPKKATNELENFLVDIWNQYHLPIWLTEFALQNFGVSPSPIVTADQQNSFLQEAIPMLEKLPFLERYAFFALPPGDTENNKIMTMLSDFDGNLTPLGYQFSQLGIGNTTNESFYDIQFDNSSNQQSDFTNTTQRIQQWESSSGLLTIRISLLATVLSVMSWIYLCF